MVNSSVFCAAEDVRIEKLNVNSKAKSLRDDFVFMMISLFFYRLFVIYRIVFSVLTFGLFEWQCDDEACSRTVTGVEGDDAA